jgi:hypothetical protein
VEAARVLERIVERQLHVFCPPEDESRPPEPLELLPRIVVPNRTPGAARVRVQHLPRKKSLHGNLAQTDGIGDGDDSEHDLTQQT